ncbi:response regulator [Planococcus halotolerans]|uniref:Transcriptional regulatory protein n=1 Tax=Planococcus halotolerans TaxID=2233542 RepID=A0A365L6H3_9BACL|nr:response regulator [Planococcus halotolerans]QHJ70287.1 response regulator [Planococcus halotolerans]RAZ80983.1 DNA-binding response regulator [Planococcus halotolerans]
MLSVLIAEDDFRVANIHEQFLKKVRGTKLVGKTSNCKETLAAVKKYKPDLIILDNYMPDGLGIDLIEEIREINNPTDVILVSAANEKEYIETAIRKGVKGIIIKPASLERFIFTIQKYIDDKISLERKDKVEQSFLDDLFGVKIAEESTTAVKGIDPLTLEKVISILKQNKTGITAEKTGEKMGASRTTARRYLEYLVSIDECYAELVYGIVGRPERNYYLK